MKVAIIGSGFSGALTATQLLRNFKPASSKSLTIDLYEKGEKNARGVAYSTESDVHYLNVPAGKMAAFPDDPDHFLRWLEETGQKAEPTAFVRRKVYAKYLEKILIDAERQAAPTAVLNRKFQEVVQWTGDLAHNDCHNDCNDDYAAVVLATGNFPPRDVPVKAGADFYSSARYIRDPWQPGGLAKIEKDQPVLLLGTGLTMVDVALELQAKGHQGAVFALSRHGYLPQVHRAATSAVSMPQCWETGEFQVREIFSWLRSFEDQWRPAIDSLRPHTQSLWKRLSDHQRARFFRHCRILWDIHRHRIAPQVGEAVARMVADQKLKLLAGRLIHFKTRLNLSDSSSVEASYAPRDQKNDQCTLTVGYVINCTGPNNDYSQINSPLIRDLKKKHLISLHPTRLGLQVTDSGALIDEAGRVSPRLYAIGSARQGNVWETVAVPELRVQAQELALLLLKMNKSDTI